jgi:RHS repeat-associated protein
MLFTFCSRPLSKIQSGRSPETVHLIGATRDRIIRAVACVLAPLQLLVGLPLPVFAAGTASVPPAPKLISPWSTVSLPADVNAPWQPPEPVRSRSNPASRKTIPEERLVSHPAERKASMPSPAAARLIPVSLRQTRAFKAAAAELKVWQAKEEFPATSALIKASAQRPDIVAALQLSLGAIWFEKGYFSRAMDSFSSAWEASRDNTNPLVYELANEAGLNLAKILARVGRQQELTQVLDVLNQRRISGPHTEYLQVANSALASMRDLPEHAFKCGPFALLTLRDAFGLTPDGIKSLEAVKSTPRGFTLAEVAAMAAEAGAELIPAYRPKGAPMVPAAVIHWRSDHYAALTAKGENRWIVRDPTFAQDFILTEAAIDDEGSGYFLIPGPLPSGWREVSPEEATKVFGRGQPSSSSPEESGTKKKGCGMAVYSITDFLVSLNITDTPISYVPPVGPAIEFTFNYNHRATFDREGAGISHLGPKWTMDWLAYVEQADSAGMMRNYTSDGRVELYSADSIANNKPHYLSGDTMVGGVGGAPYEQVSPDGTRKIFGRIVTSSGAYSKRLLTQIIDRFGNEVNLTYDTNDRLVAVTDALNQVSLFTYADPSDSYRITGISDPFGREALLAYDTTGRLSSITDPVGIVSSFSYEETLKPDFITKLTTPYGDTLFSQQAVSTEHRVIEATDPIGRKERVEYRHGFQGVIAATENSLTVPVVPVDPANLSAGNIDFGNKYLYYGNTLRWDHKTYVEYPPAPATTANYDKAHITKWLWEPVGGYITVGVAHSTKAPLENRVWTYHEGQYIDYYGIRRGEIDAPHVVARVLADGTTQAWRYTYNAQHTLTSATDPKGRKTFYDRTTNGYDLQAVRQSRPATSSSDTLQQIAWTASRLPQTITDAALGNTGLTYHANGQAKTATNALNETTTLWYHPTGQSVNFGSLSSTATGYLVQIDGAISGTADHTRLTYDSAGRVRTVTDSEGYMLTYDYDDLDRVTVVTYPDATYEQLSYDRLDLVGVRDREGRWTRHWYNGVGQRLLTRDPAGRVTFMDFCYCGAPKILIDAEGNVTRWDYDIQGRLTKKTYADLSETTYAYAPLSSRLLKVTDALGQEKHYTYDVDDALLTTTYVNAVNATPAVTLTYETDYPRLETMTDGTGVTAFTYHPVTPTTGTLGAGRLATVDGPLTDDTLGYSYDALGRLAGRTINGTANSLTRSYDALGRLDLETNVLGSFDPAYAGHSGRATSVSMPGGLSMAYGYGTAAQDFRLQSIALKNGGTTLSSHAYTHSPMGRIETWTQALSGQPVLNWAYGYDRADQLTDAVKTPSSGATQALRYGYDRIGNRVSETTDSAVRTGAYNELNQLESWTGGGRTRVAGTLNEPGTVTVAGEPAALGAGNSFSADVDLPVGTSTVQVVAKDAANNTRTANYSVTVTGGTTASYAYDDVGNLTGKTDSGGTMVYAWDAENRLIKLTYPGGATTEMTYDGLGRRVRIVEKNTSATITDDRRFIWDGLALAERRAADGTTVKRRYFAQGVQADGNTRLYVRDHLGSVNQLINPSSPSTPTATFAYDPFGKRTQVAGAEDSDAAYTGHYYHSSSGLHLPLYRAYDGGTGRWLSRDPIAEQGGINMYGYVLNNPILYHDPLGLWGAAGAIAGGIIGGISGAVSGVTSGALSGGLSGAVIGGIAGALGGAAAGALIGAVNPFASAIAGQVVGGAVGAMVGDIAGQFLGHIMSKKPADCFELNVAQTLVSGAMGAVGVGIGGVAAKGLGGAAGAAVAGAGEVVIAPATGAMQAAAGNW